VDENTVFWIGGAVAAFVFVDVLIVEIRRCLREARRIGSRLAAYVDLPVVTLASEAQRDLTRLLHALEEMAALLDRARIALAALGFGRPNGASN